MKGKKEKKKIVVIGWGYCLERDPIFNCDDWHHTTCKDMLFPWKQSQAWIHNNDNNNTNRSERDEKNCEAPTGFGPMTFAIPVRCSTDWAMKPCWKQVRCEFNLYHYMKRMQCMIKIMSELQKITTTITTMYNLQWQWQWQINSNSN